MSSYLANAVKALALAELVFDLPRTLFGLFKAAHSVGLLTVTEVDVAQVKVCTVEILQQLTLPLQDKNGESTITKTIKRKHSCHFSIVLPEFVH